MEKRSSSESNISVDSLEPCRKTLLHNLDTSDEHVDTILVPFYENDVLMKVPKIDKKNKKSETKNNKRKKEPIPNYLINKNKKKGSYLEMFRKQFTFPTPDVPKSPLDDEVSSLRPEFGDTERESIGDDVNVSRQEEYYNTEAYNEIFYERLLNQEYEDCLNCSLEQGIEHLELNDDARSKTSENYGNDLRSVSEVSRPRRQSRYSACEPLPANLKLGGLGPDMEKIKPRLERARSLQRYSEKVRMENRVRIYKKSIEAEKASRAPSAKATEQKETKDRASYLINKTRDQKTNIVRKVYESKCKSAVLKLRDTKTTTKEDTKVKHKENETAKASGKDTKKRNIKLRTKKSSDEINKEKNNGADAPGTATINMTTSDRLPLQINFMVNVGGNPSIRPSSALKNLEEMHRMYQERVKSFTRDY